MAVHIARPLVFCTCVTTALHGGFVSGNAPPVAGALNRLAPVRRLFVVLSAATNRAQLVSNESLALCAAKLRLCRPGVWRTLCHTALAESGFSSIDTYRRERDGLAFCSRAKHSTLGAWSGRSRRSRLVGFPNFMASLDARRAGLLNVPHVIESADP